MKCENCGTEIRKNQKFCPKCGENLINKIVEYDENNTINNCNKKDNNTLEKTEQNKKIVIKQKKAKALIACVLCIVIVISSITGVFLFKKNRETIPADSDKNYVYLDGNIFDDVITNTDSAFSAIESIKDLIGLTDAKSELSLDSINVIDGNKYYRFYQRQGNIPVYGRDIVVASDADGKPLILTSNYVNLNQKVSIELGVTAEQIQKSVNNYFNTNQISISEIKEENYVIYSFDKTSKPVLAYKTIILFDNSAYEILIDLNTSEILQSCQLLENAAEYVYSEDNSISTEGWKSEDGKYLLHNDKYNIDVFDVDNINTRDENGEIKEDFREYGLSTIASDTNKFGKQGVSLLDNLIKCNNYYDKLGDKGFDSIHGGINCSYQSGNNSSGGGGIIDGKKVAALLIGKNMDSSDVDVVAHEYTHAVTDCIANFKNTQDNLMPSAIDEGFSDIFGELIEEQVLNLDAPNWCMDSEEISLKRNIINPQEQGNCSNVNDSNGSNSYTYAYSTVISHAAYLMWNGSDAGLDIFKIDSATLASLWYRSLYLMHSDVTFNQCANAVILTAESMYDAGELTQAQLACVRRSFESVGIYADMLSNLSENATNKAKVAVKDINGNNLSSYYLKVTDKDSNVITDGVFTDSNPYIIDVEDSGIYKFTVKKTKSDSTEFEYRVRILNIDKNNTFLNLQTSLNIDKTDQFSDDIDNTEYTNEQIDADSQTDSIPDSSTDEITWTFDDKTGVLSIHGSGEITSSDVGWGEHINDIKEIFFDDNITSICSWTFAGYSNLEKVKLPYNLKIIEKYAFSDNPKLKSITLNNSLVKIGAEAFKDCISLDSLKIPDSVTTLEGSAFSGCISLKSLSIGSGISTLPFSVFNGNTSLETVTIPDNVKSIELYAFNDCTNLKKVVIGNGVTVIGEWAFQNCTSLTDISFGENVERISNCCFSSCISLTSITLPNKLNSIGSQAFRSCTSLKSIKIPASVKTIEPYAFTECSSLTDIYYSGTNDQWSNVKMGGDYGDTDEILENVTVHCS